MIGSINILDEINRLLVQKYPEHTVYIDLCPKNFDRPCFLIELVNIQQRPINAKTIQETDYFTITCFDITDDYSHSDTINLLMIQQGVLEIFRKGYISVDDRAIDVIASSGGRNFDQAYIDLQFEYFDDRSDAIDNTPLINKVYTTVKEE